MCTYICKYTGCSKYFINFYLGNIIEKNCSNKSCRVQKDLFTDQFNLKWRRQNQIKVISIFLNGTLLLFSESNS